MPIVEEMVEVVLNNTNAAHYAKLGYRVAQTRGVKRGTRFKVRSTHITERSNERKHLGTFDTPYEAALVAHKRALELGLEEFYPHPREVKNVQKADE